MDSLCDGARGHLTLIISRKLASVHGESSQPPPRPSTRTFGRSTIAPEYRGGRDRGHAHVEGAPALGPIRAASGSGQPARAA
jgi:hypothetical protein